MKKLVVMMVLLAVFLPGMAFAEEMEEGEGECEVSYCEDCDDLEGALEEEPPSQPLVDALLSIILNKVITDNDYMLPWHVYGLCATGRCDDQGRADIRLVLDGLLGELSSIVSDNVVASMWETVKNTYALQLDAADYGINNRNEMADYLYSSGILDELNMSKFSAKTLMALYQTAPTYLEPVSNPPSTPPMPVMDEWPPEYSAAGEMLNWPIYAPTVWKQGAVLSKKIVRAGGTVVVVLPNEWWHEAALLYMLDNNGGNMTLGDLNGVKFMYLKSDLMWMANAGPLFVKDTSGNWVVVNFANKLPFFPPLINDLTFPEKVAEYLGLPYYEFDENIYISKGNLHTDGAGTVFILDAVFAFNPGLTLEYLESILATYMGAERVVVVEQPSIELSGDVDVIVRPMSEDTLMVAKAPFWAPAIKDALDTTAYFLGNLQSQAGSGDFYDIKRIAVPNNTLTDPLGIVQYSYANSIIVNGKVIRPSYGDLFHPFAVLQDVNASLSYEAALPGFGGVEGVYWRNTVSGGVRCFTMGLQADFISTYLQ